MSPRPLSDRAALAAIVAACAIWGASFLFAQVALAELPVTDLILWRFAIAAAVLAPLAARHRPRRRDLPLFALSGILCVPVTFLPQLEGLSRTNVASASLIVETGTPLLALAGAAFRRERLSRRGWTAVGLSTLGVALMVGLPGPGRTWLGDLLVFVSMVATAAWVLVAMPLVGRYGGLAATAWSLAFGAAAQLPVAWLDGAPRTPETAVGWAAVLALGLGCSAASYALWNRGLECLPASRAGVYLNLEPVVGAALGIGLLGEPLAAGLLAGGGLVLAASILASLPAGPPPADAATVVPVPAPRDACPKAA